MLFNRVLVTGANGLLGQALVQRLSQSPQYDVLATAREDTSRLEIGSFGYVPLDVTQPDDVEAVFQDFTPNVVVNCAALADVEECDENRNKAWAVNARAVKTLAKQSRDTGARLVQISTDFVFNGKHGPYDENDRPDPVNYYGRSKLAGENALREAGRTNWAIVRTALPYGPGQDLSGSNLVLQMLDRLLKNETLCVRREQYCTPTYVEDLAAGIERLLQLEERGLYHLSGGELLSLHELACTVSDVFDLDESLIQPVSAEDLDETVERPSRTGLIIHKAETELGYDPRSLEDGLQAMKKRLHNSPSTPDFE